MPPSLYVSNPVATYIAAGVGLDSTSTSLTVTDGTLWTMALPTVILIEQEICHLTAVVGDVFTITRGEESTVAAAHSGGVLVQTTLTAGLLYAVFAQVP